MKNVFLILAAGHSSRFGGYPKAFCKADDAYIVQRTVDLGAPHFDKTYLALNRGTFSAYQNAVTGCRALAIGTGQGDAHSFLRAARLIKQDCNADRITLCWGDTFYLESEIFRYAAQIDMDKTCVGVSFAAIDPEPYAWYEVEKDTIKAAHFRAKDGLVQKGIHDQSIFTFHLDTICSQLEAYMKALGLNDEEDYINSELSTEMRLLDSFAYFYQSDLLPMKYALVEPGQCYSFNTKAELKALCEKVAQRGARAQTGKGEGGKNV